MIAKGLRTSGDLSLTVFQSGARIKMRLLLKIIGVIAVPHFVCGVRLPGCVSDRVSVDETSSTVVTCDQLGAQEDVGWSLKGGASQSDVILGSCPPQGSCLQGNRYNLTRTSTESTLNITPSADIRSLSSYRIQCSDTSDAKSCAMDIIYPAVVPAQICHVEAQSGSWTFSGSCNITKTFSSSNTYQCHVYRGTSQSSQPTSVTTVSYTAQPHSDPKYRTGSCVFTSDFTSLLAGITTRQDFYFRIQVYPGPTQRVKGPVTIQKPVTPRLRCPDIVAENTTLTCTCNTTNIGQPPGRLLWSRDSVPTITEGQYDVSTLTLPPQTLTRRDHGVTQFRCDVRWAGGTYKAVYTANVGFPPSQTTLKVNSAPLGQSVEVSENETVTFTCSAEGGNPQSTLTLSDTTSTLTRGSSPLTHSLDRATCQHSGRYTCSASNGFGSHLTSSTTLYVTCTPRAAQKDLKLELNYLNQSVKDDFDVIAYPALDASLTDFKYLGRNGTDPPSDISGISLTASCLPKSVNVYTSTCTLTVQDMTSSTAAGVYTVALSNTGEHRVRFTVLYNAPVSEPNTGGDSGNGAVIGGAIGCVVAIIVAGVVIVVVVLKRRRKARGTQNTPGQNRYLEMEEAGGDPEAQGMPLSFAPTDVYAEVNKKAKKPKQTTEAEANGDSPADVYAEVDKTKKKTPAKKPPGEAKKDKKKKKDANEAAHVYGNVEDIKHTKGAKPKKPVLAAKEASSSGKTVNPDGLIYTTVDLSHKPKSGSTPPKKTEEDHVIYSEVKTS